MQDLSPMAKTCRLLASTAVLLLIVGSLGAKFDYLHYRAGLLMFVLAATIGIVIISVAAFSTRRQKNEASRRSLSSASVIAAIPVLLLGLSVIRGGDAPMIHEVSTDLEQAPRFQAALSEEIERENQPNLSAELIAAQRLAYPELQSLRSHLSAAEAYAQARAIAEDMGWEIIFEQTERGLIEATDTSFWFGFKDDIVIRVLADAQGSRIDLRSLSRVGKGDLGANAKRVSAFLEAFSRANNDSA